MHFLKDIQKLSLRSKHIYSHLTIKHYFTSNSMKMNFIMKLQEGKYYSILGFSDSVDILKLSDNDIKRNYLGMVRKYHSDNTVDL